MTDTYPTRDAWEADRRLDATVNRRHGPAVALWLVSRPSNVDSVHRLCGQHTSAMGKQWPIEKKRGRTLRHNKDMRRAHQTSKTVVDRKAWASVPYTRFGASDSARNKQVRRYHTEWVRSYSELVALGDRELERRLIKDGILRDRVGDGHLRRGEVDRYLCRERG